MCAPISSAIGVHAKHTVGETRVDLEHLLEDLRDAYPGGLEETILTEVVANSLDSGARIIAITSDPAAKALIVVDDGAGMARRDLARYHDLAASTKIRGHGIGFAGVGIKLGLLASDEVRTETRRGAIHVATSWRLSTPHRAPWKWVPPEDLVERHGTAVRLTLRNPLSPLLDGGFIEEALLCHFQPLLDSTFDGLLASHYREPVRFVVNTRGLPRGTVPPDSAPLSIRVGRQRKPSAVGYLFRDPTLSEDLRGVAVSTLGKVIKRGWDWLGLTPAAAGTVGGLVEVPALAQALTLNKADFLRTGPRGALYLAYRKAIQEAVSAQLAAWGEGPTDERQARKTRSLERDIDAVLGDLAADFPLLAALVDRRRGGQRRLPVGGASIAPGPSSIPLESVPAGGSAEVEAPELPNVPPPTQEEPLLPPGAPPELPDGGLPATNGVKRPARYGLTIAFENRPGDEALGRLVENTVWVNEAHPAYSRAIASRSEGYHIALAVAMALAPLAVEAPEAQRFISVFLARWGEGLGRPRRRGRPKAS